MSGCKRRDTLGLFEVFSFMRGLGPRRGPFTGLSRRGGCRAVLEDACPRLRTLVSLRSSLVRRTLSLMKRLCRAPGCGTCGTVGMLCRGVMGRVRFARISFEGRSNGVNRVGGTLSSFTSLGGGRGRSCGRLRRRVRVDGTENSKGLEHGMRRRLSW